MCYERRDEEERKREIRRKMRGMRKWKRGEGDKEGTIVDLAWEREGDIAAKFGGIAVEIASPRSPLSCM